MCWSKFCLLILNLRSSFFILVVFLPQPLIHFWPWFVLNYFTPQQIACPTIMTVSFYFICKEGEKKEHKEPKNKDETEPGEMYGLMFCFCFFIFWLLFPMVRSPNSLTIPLTVSQTTCNMSRCAYQKNDCHDREFASVWGFLSTTCMKEHQCIKLTAYKYD